MVNAIMYCKVTKVYNIFEKFLYISVCNITIDPMLALEIPCSCNSDLNSQTAPGGDSYNVSRLAHWQFPKAHESSVKIKCKYKATLTLPRMFGKRKNNLSLFVLFCNALHLVYIEEWTEE